MTDAPRARPPRILSIAGSDSGGGAGIQADIKTIQALGGFATTAITAITAQNTLGVTAVERVSPALVVAQIDAVLSDIGADAIKIGMIGSAAVAAAVADRIEAIDPLPPLVFDPVMVATSGATLADAETIAAFERLMRIAALVTPNLPELSALAPDAAPGEDAGVALARRVGTAVLVKGGHAAGEMLVDRLVGPEGERARWSAPRLATRHTHGTGCTLSSAIALGLGAGLALGPSIERARAYVRRALEAAPGFGAGAGPMGH